MEPCLTEAIKSATASSEKEYEQIQQDMDNIQMDLENERCFFFLVLELSSFKL